MIVLMTIAAVAFVVVLVWDSPLVRAARERQLRRKSARKAGGRDA